MEALNPENSATPRMGNIVPGFFMSSRVASTAESVIFDVELWVKKIVEKQKSHPTHPKKIAHTNCAPHITTNPSYTQDSKQLNPKSNPSKLQIPDLEEEEEEENIRRKTKPKNGHLHGTDGRHRQCRLELAAAP